MGSSPAPLLEVEGASGLAALSEVEGALGFAALPDVEWVVSPEGSCGGGIIGPLGGSRLAR